MGKIPGYLLFAVAMWFMWEWRCNSVFDSKFVPPVCAGKIILNYVTDWLKVDYNTGSKPGKKTCFLTWYSPEENCIKPNVDGSLNIENDTISAGGVIRNHMKIWLRGFALNKGYEKYY
ncbi:hypothetical protein Dsin_006223 [Dipteronia sinensis]|uniref:Uncharacterized protein n=1 Tax=Dipteronia sinensis TaxID=43782 RepID=A0AAE0AY06_9ROSI|nr:hypothetical protein Dsin_006223 [Dipteronia sinensis]